MTPPDAKKRSEKAVPDAPSAPESLDVARTEGVVMEVTNVGAVAIATTVPDPVRVYSPSTPALS